MTIAGCVPWILSIVSSMRHGSWTSRRPATGVVRVTSGGSGHGMPSRRQPTGLGPTGRPSNVHSTWAGGAARPQTVPQRWSTWFVRASPYGTAFDCGVGSQSRRASVGPAAGPACAGGAHHVLGVLPGLGMNGPFIATLTSSYRHQRSPISVHGFAGAPEEPNAAAPITMLPVPVGALRKAIAGMASSGTVGRSPPTATSTASASLPSIGPFVPVPSRRAGDRAMSETPAMSGRGSGVGVVGAPIVSETQPSTEKKKKSTLPQTSPWTYGSLTMTPPTSRVPTWTISSALALIADDPEPQLAARRR